MPVDLELSDYKMAVTSERSAPYAPAGVMMDLIRRYRERGLPTPITADVLTRAGVSDSLNSRTLQALEVLDLIDGEGRPTPVFEGLRLSPESEYQDKLGAWLRGAYADVLNFVDPAAASDVEIRDAFRSYKPHGQQDRMVTLFLALCEAAAMAPARKKRSASNKDGVSRPVRQQRQERDASNLPDTDTPPTPDAPAKINRGPGSSQIGGLYNPNTAGKALEYQLIDLMSESDIDDTVKTSIWALVQYLTARKAKSPKEEIGD